MTKVNAPFKSLKIAENRPLDNFSNIQKIKKSVENLVRIPIKKCSKILIINNQDLYSNSMQHTVPGLDGRHKNEDNSNKILNSN